MNNKALSQRKTYSLHFIVLIALISLLFYGCVLPKAQMYPGERVEDRKTGGHQSGGAKEISVR